MKMSSSKSDLHDVELNTAETESAETDAETVSQRSQKKQSNTSDVEERNVCHDYEDVLSLIGFGWTQWLVLLICGLLLMMVINETMGMGIITIASQCDFVTTSVDKAIMSAASFIGILLSSYFWGYLSDTVGRRTVLIYTTYTGNVISFVSIFIPNYWAYVFFRFAVGFFIAGASSTTYAYLGEFFTTRHRPVVINYSSMFVGIAMAYVPAVAWLVLSMDWSLSFSDSFNFRPWRLLSIFNLLPGLIATTVLVFFPESPKILLALHKNEEAYAAVNWICMRNTGQNLTDLKVFKLKTDMRKHQTNALTASNNCFATVKKMWNDTLPLFKRPHVLNFVISCTVMCGLFLCSSGMGLWYTEIQNRVGENPDNGLLTVCEVIDASMEEKHNSSSNVICNDSINTKSYIDSITFGFSYIIGYIVLGIIINPLGRKLLMIGALIISGLCGIALHWILEPVAIVVCFCVFLVLPGLCVSVMSGAVVDLMPTHLRGKAVCICLMLGRAGSVIGSNIIGVLLESYCSLTFSLFSACVWICALTFVLPV